MPVALFRMARLKISSCLVINAKSLDLLLFSMSL